VNYLSATAPTIAVFLELGFVGLWLAVGSVEQRQSHFWVRLLLAALAVPLLMGGLDVVARLNVLSDNAAKVLLPLPFSLGVVGLMFVPRLLYRRSGSPPGPSESDGGGGGRGPRPPSRSPDPPRGGIPLPDADQASARVRDHARPRFAEVTRRRPAHKPRRTPART
jgi:hypothetical protein